MLDLVLLELKRAGPLTAQQLADKTGHTSMGVRKQLEAAREQGLVRHDDLAEGVGRPARWWELTETGHARFPDRHHELLVRMIDDVRRHFGKQGLETLIQAREQHMRDDYAMQLADTSELEMRLRRLTAVRNAEGYMAELRVAESGYELVEHHCPICAAAKTCQDFCRSELELFRDLLPGTTVTRTAHALTDGPRCIYRIIPIQNE